ncbi:MAG: hypothetical protein GC129_02100 [Proteobacteria bacterium]|nr:hypothetical protein [Pseudomonadota bacterium]
MSDDYKVGYKKPPQSGKFKKGQSGNPSGRPKRVAPLLYDILNMEMSQIVTVVINGQETKLPTVHLVAKALLAKAAKGDVKACQMLMKLQQELNARHAPHPGYLVGFVERAENVFQPPPGTVVEKEES